MQFNSLVQFHFETERAQLTTLKLKAPLFLAP